MNVSRLSRLGFVGLVALLAPACGAGSEDDASPGSQAAVTRSSGAMVVISAEDSEAARHFILGEFLSTFGTLAKGDSDDRASGASTAKEIENFVYKVKRDDGTIECVQAPASCTFKFKSPVEQATKLPVSAGGTGTLASALRSAFNSVPVDDEDFQEDGPLPSMPGYEDDRFVIGRMSTGIYIECGTKWGDHGFEAAKCSFHLPTK